MRPLRVLFTAWAAALVLSPGVRALPEKAPAPFDEAWLSRGFEAFAAEAEKPRGEGPRSPAPSAQSFLLRVYARTREPRALALASRTLSEMASGGIRDHIGGGFHRRSVDRGWRMPDPEKRLADNARLAFVYLEAYQAGKDPEMARVARQTLDYALRDMRGKEGGFYSSEHVVYIWSAKEIEEALGRPAAEVFFWRYGVRPEGNLPPGTPGDTRGANVVYAARTTAETAARFGKTEGEVERLLAVSREKLRAARNSRPRRVRDESVVAAWNGLMLSALAKGGQVLEEKAYLEAAEKAARFLRSELYSSKGRRLGRVWMRGRAGMDGAESDYAYLAQGLLDLYEASFDPDKLDWALELSLALSERPSGGRNRRFPAEGEDDSEASAVAALNLLRLAQFFGRPDLRAAAEKTLARHGRSMAEDPLGCGRMLAALGAFLERPRQIVIAGEASDPAVREMLRAVHARYIPDKILMVVPPGPVQRRLASRIPALKGMGPIDGRATAYICADFACELPTGDLREVESILDGRGLPR